MSDKKSTDSRRKLLKSIAAGSGAVVAGKSLPESWSKPVINSIVLPAHAELTDGSDSGAPEVTTTEAPCIIEGTYCWFDEEFTVDGKFDARVTFTVGSDGSVLIHRTNERNAYTWDGTGFTSKGSLGGDFDISLVRTPAGGKTLRLTGTIDCNSDSFDGDFYGFSDRSYTATKGPCPPRNPK